jgi:hypothetical protein
LLLFAKKYTRYFGSLLEVLGRKQNTYSSATQTQVCVEPWPRVSNAESC